MQSGVNKCHRETIRDKYTQKAQQVQRTTD